MPFAVHEPTRRESEYYTATMQTSPAGGPNRPVEAGGVLVTTLHTDNVSVVYIIVLQMGSSCRQQINKLHCGLLAGPVLLWRDRNSAYALKQADVTQSCLKRKSFTSR